MQNSVTRARDLRKRMTETEDLLWRELRNRAFMGLKFRRQQPIDGYIADFCCFEKRLVIEVDGEIHDQPDQAAYDQERDSHLAHQGFHVLRVTNHQIKEEMAKVLQRIQLAVSGPSPLAGEGRGSKWIK